MSVWTDGGGRGKAGELSVGRGAEEGQHLLVGLVGQIGGDEEGDKGIGRQGSRESTFTMEERKTRV